MSTNMQEINLDNVEDIVNNAMTALPKDMRALGAAVVDLQTLSSLNKQTIIRIGEQWPCLFLSGNEKKAVLQLLADLRLKEIKKLTEKTPIDTDPQT